MKLDKAISCLKEIGVKPKVNDFSSRLIIQKSIYLLQLKGIKTDFGYGLYIRGPYSPALTKEIYRNSKKVEQLDSSDKLSSSESKIVGEFNEIFSELKPSMLEIAATYSFFAFDQKQDPITALKHVKHLKPFYSEAKIAVGVSKAKEFLFQPSKKDMENLNEETKAWREASLKNMMD